MTTVIACETIKDEIMYVADKLQCKHPFLWMPSSLHKYPERLRHRLQEEIDKCDEDEDNILLLFGYCGNAVLGLSSQHARLIIPKMDDCISLLLGGNQRRKDLSMEGRAYYLTEGWMNSDSGIAVEYNRCLMKYGYDKSNMVFKVMLKGYKSFDVIDTGIVGAETMSDMMDAVQKLAECFNLEHKVIEGTLEVLGKALYGQWDEDFVIVEPGEKVKFEYFGFDIQQSKMQDVISI
jgi:hypothetical protein